REKIIQLWEDALIVDVHDGGGFDLEACASDDPELYGCILNVDVFDLGRGFGLKNLPRRFCTFAGEDIDFDQDVLVLKRRFKDVKRAGIDRRLGLTESSRTLRMGGIDQDTAWEMLMGFD